VVLSLKKGTGTSLSLIECAASRTLSKLL